VAKLLSSSRHARVLKLQYNWAAHTATEADDDRAGLPCPVRVSIEQLDALYCGAKTDGSDGDVAFCCVGTQNKENLGLCFFTSPTATSGHNAGCAGSSSCVALSYTEFDAGP
jgi:hypothetical protein